MWLLVTIVVFFAARWLCQKVKSPFMNPLLVSLAVLNSTADLPKSAI